MGEGREGEAHCGRALANSMHAQSVITFQQIQSQIPINTTQLREKIFLNSSSEILPSLQIKDDEFTFI